jgi:hypothetical protein
MATHESIFVSYFCYFSCSLYPATPYWFFFSFTLKMTPETNSTTFVLATMLQTENQPIVDWGNRNRVNLFICVTSSELHCREVVQCRSKDFSTLRRSTEHIPSNLVARFLSKEFLYLFIQRWVCLCLGLVRLGYWLTVVPHAVDRCLQISTRNRVSCALDILVKKRHTF